MRIWVNWQRYFCTVSVNVWGLILPGSISSAIFKNCAHKWSEFTVVSYWRLSMKICFSLFCQKYRYLGILDGTVLPSVQTFFFFPVLETQFLYNYIVASKKQLSCAINKGYVIKSCFTSLTWPLEMGGKASRQPSFALLLPVAVCKTRLLSWLRGDVCLS